MVHQPLDAAVPGAVVVAADVGVAVGQDGAGLGVADRDVDRQDQGADLVHEAGHGHIGADGARQVEFAAIAGAYRLEVGEAGTAVTAIRLEGFGPSVAYRADRVTALFAGRAQVADIAGDEAKLFWQRLRDVLPLAEPGDRPLWRLSVPPAAGAAILGRLTEALDAEGFYDWGGGLIWAVLKSGADRDAGAAAVRGALGREGGHATLLRAPDAVRAAVDVFQPQPEALAALSRRVKHSFDPKTVLNPGRMTPGL